MSQSHAIHKNQRTILKCRYICFNKVGIIVIYYRLFTNSIAGDCYGFGKTSLLINFYGGNSNFFNSNLFDHI